MAHVFVACPQCGAGYKIAKEHLATEAVCRACGHRWIPAEAHPTQGQPDEPIVDAEPATPVPEAEPPAPSAEAEPPAGKGQGRGGGGSPADALAALAAAAGEHRGGTGPKAPAEQPPVRKPPAAKAPAEAKPPAPKPAPAPAEAKPSAPPKPAETPAPETPASQPASEKPPAAEPAAVPASPAPNPPAGKKPKAGGGASAPIDALEAMARAAGGGKGAKPPAAPARKKSAGGAAPTAAGKADAPSSDPLIGKQVNGFKIQGRLGTGGFGIVYRAFDTNLERSVAIKMLPANLAKAGKGVVERFLREARSAAKLAHPNIVTIHQICPYKNTYYIVMELIDDGALHEVLGKKRHLNPEEATRIVRAAAEGLGHAHTRGIIHRDIKPGNIMLTSDGQVKVSDFGLARDVLQGRDIVGAGHSLGTPRYMAPEQALGEEPTAASDLYSLAATYFVLLTGHAPFDGADEREIMKKQVQAPVPDPRSFRPELPAAVFRFFEKAMAKEPADRYTVSQDFIEALDRLDFAKADSDVTDSQDLVDQLSGVGAADRGAHLSQTLGRAVRRAQRQRTPMSESAVDDVLGVGTAAGRKAGWKLWVLLGVLALLVIAGAVVAAVLLAPRGPEGGTPEQPTGAAATATGETGTGQAPTEGTGTGTAAPAEGEGTGEAEPPEKPPASPLEDVAQEVLGEVQAYESDLDTPVYELMRMYRENVIQVYPGTRAAETAAKALERLKKGKRLQAGGAEETPAEKPPEDTQPAEEKPAEEKPAEEKPAEEKPAEEKPAEAKPEA